VETGTPKFKVQLGEGKLMNKPLRSNPSGVGKSFVRVRANAQLVDPHPQKIVHSRISEAFRIGPKSSGEGRTQVPIYPMVATKRASAVRAGRRRASNPPV